MLLTVQQYSLKKTKSYFDAWLLNWDSFISLKGTDFGKYKAWLQTACGSKSQHNVSAYLKRLRFFPTATTDSSCWFIAKTKQQQKMVLSEKQFRKQLHSNVVVELMKASKNMTTAPIKQSDVVSVVPGMCDQSTTVVQTESSQQQLTSAVPRVRNLPKPISWCYFKVCGFYWNALIFARWRFVVHTEWTLMTYEVGHIKGFCSDITNMDTTSMYLGIDTSGWTVMFVT